VKAKQTRAERLHKAAAIARAFYRRSKKKKPPDLNTLLTVRFAETRTASWEQSVAGRAWVRCPRHGMLPVVSVRDGWMRLACRCQCPGGPQKQSAKDEM
jgi:hypothetical protein